MHTPQGHCIETERKGVGRRGDGSRERGSARGMKKGGREEKDGGGGMERGGVLWEYNIAGHGDRLVCKRDKMTNH